MMLVLWGLLFPLSISLFPSMLHLLLPWWLGILCWLSRYVPFAVQAKYRPPYSASWFLVSVRIFFFSLSSSHASTKYYWMAIWLQSRGSCTRSTDVLKIRHHSLEASQLHWSSQDMSKWVECEVGSTLIGMFKCCPMFLLASFCLP